MPSYILTYDLKEPGQGYDALTKGIWVLGDVYHLQHSVWLLKSIEPIDVVYEHLAKFLDGNDDLFVATLTGEARSTSRGPISDLAIDAALNP